MPEPKPQPWWVDRWLALLDSYRFKKRLERARNYAREGNVLDIAFVTEGLEAQVQGTDPRPYQIDLQLEQFSDEDWHYVVAGLAEQAYFSAELLAGSMPEKIETVFVQNGLSLFPFNLGEVRSRCSCPDKANPCKHIGAVYYQLAGYFQADPFMIFRLRGRSRSHLLAQLRDYRRQTPEALADYEQWQALQVKANATTKTGSSTEQTQSKTRKKRRTKAEYEKEFEAFWQFEQPLPDALTIIVPPDNPQALLDQLGEMPLPYETSKKIRQALGQIYRQVSDATWQQQLASTEESDT